jgi:hypothetical protein
MGPEAANLEMRVERGKTGGSEAMWSERTAL